jgi:replicative DNA helicase
MTVAAEPGEMSRIDGAPYVNTLVASVPLASNAGCYAHITQREGDPARLGRLAW